MTIPIPTPGDWSDLLHNDVLATPFVPRLAEMFRAEPGPLWQIAPQIGVSTAVTSIPEGPDDPPAWDFDHLRTIKERFTEAGLDLQVIESAPYTILEEVKVNGPGRDEGIRRFCELLENMGRLGIGVMCHNWMAGIGWYRSDFGIQMAARGNALVSGYDHTRIDHTQLTVCGEVSEEALWANMEHFLKRVVPVAEKSGVKLAVHPDDPPISPVRGMGRILTNPDAFQRVIDMVPSPNNGMTFCQGNFSTMGADVPEEIRRFGRQAKVFFVHFRDVLGTPERFVETFHNLGQTDMLAAMRAWAEVGFDGPIRPDHVPTLAGESNENPGYELLGRLHAIGYMTGLIEAVNSELSKIRD
ncbi:MAG: mannonate dehydratase [Thermomicrobiales bacterium]